MNLSREFLSNTNSSTGNGDIDQNEVTDIWIGFLSVILFAMMTPFCCLIVAPCVSPLIDWLYPTPPLDDIDREAILGRENDEDISGRQTANSLVSAAAMEEDVVIVGDETVPIDEL